MSYTVELERAAIIGLGKLPRSDQHRIMAKLRDLTTDPRPVGVTKLTGTDGWRIKSGNYRIVYLIDDSARIVTVTRIAPPQARLQEAVMAALVPISEAKARLAELVRDSDDDDVFLLRHGRPAAVVMSLRRHEALLEEIEDLRDRLSIHEREGLTTDLDKVAAELGL